MSSDPRTFIVVFLLFWYLVVNDRGRSSWLDFAGFYGAATANVFAGYAAAAAVLAAHLYYSAQLRRWW